MGENLLFPPAVFCLLMTMLLEFGNPTEIDKAFLQSPCNHPIEPNDPLHVK